MDVDRIVVIEVEAAAWDRHGSTAVEQRRIEVPAGIGPPEVRSYVESVLGPVTGTVHTRHATLGDLVVGWIFDPAGLTRLGMEHDGAALVAVPFVRYADGTRKELAVHEALRDGALRERTPGDRDGPPAHEPATRLARRQVRLHHCDTRGMAYDIEGWLHTMVREGHTYLVIEPPGRGRYVQFVTHDGTWLRGEVVGPAHLVGHPPLGEVELLTILALGWFEPDDGSGANFWREWGEPGSTRPLGSAEIVAAAGMAARTLELFGPIDPERTTVSTGQSVPGGVH